MKTEEFSRVEMAAEQENETLRRLLKAEQDRNDMLLARVRGQDSKLRAENTVAPRRLTRDQLRLRTIKENPDLRQSSDLFREALVANALQQEGGNLARVANFLGMSKGEVSNHIRKIQRKIEQARTPVAQAVEKAITHAEEKLNGTTEETAADQDLATDPAERRGVGDLSEEVLSLNGSDCNPVI